jgi:hypothetical protein
VAEQLPIRIPRNRNEAAAQIIQDGFTISACLAVGLAFPLPGEIGEIARQHKRIDLGFFLNEARVRYLPVWGMITYHQFVPAPGTVACNFCHRAQADEAHQRDFYDWLAEHENDPPPKAYAQQIPDFREQVIVGDWQKQEGFPGPRKRR